ncbi:hypothetical protein E2562_031594 [Oryza meyeriana var. granulata]|uniref:Peptidase C1A papain C-terminal domain-containing protein n=1 Tax=Oryza meyeriana var. granulata TaxID=110450 RepID=A0A6G1CK30_9ORYZ|nr:hypothetical protein E2562_031594 [Oryza meyeriana var. granulata]
MQQLLDAVDVNCRECIGGNSIPCFSYLIQNGGQVPYAAYPYVGFQNRPHLPIQAMGVTIDHYGCCFDVTDEGLKELVASFLVVIAVGADDDFHFYITGVEDGPSYTIVMVHMLGISHLVAIVGYGMDKLGKEFWLVKNSHGTRFGMRKAQRIHEATAELLLEGLMEPMVQPMMIKNQSTHSRFSLSNPAAAETENLRRGVTGTARPPQSPSPRCRSTHEQYPCDDAAAVEAISAAFRRRTTATSREGNQVLCQSVRGTYMQFQKVEGGRWGKPEVMAVSLFGGAPL